jgi:hypothetical protein
MPLHNDHQLYVVSKILGGRYNEYEMFLELLVAWRGFPVGKATWELLYAAKDETSVDIICRRFSCIFMRKSRIRQIK